MAATTKGNFDDWSFGEEKSESEAFEESEEVEENTPISGSNCRSRDCKKKSCCNDCCPCQDEFEEVHCAIENLEDKVCDIQDSQEQQDTCLAILKAGVANNGDLLGLLQVDVDQILIDLGTIIEGGGIGGGPPDGGNGCNGPLVCIKCGSCGTCGDTCCDCCECPPVEPPIEPPGEIITPPEELCLIRAGSPEFLNGDLVELWFSA